MDKIRVGVVGAGKMGAIHAKVYNQLPQSEFVAVVDTNAEKAEKVAENPDVERFFGSGDFKPFAYMPVASNTRWNRTDKTVVQFKFSFDECICLRLSVTFCLVLSA